MQQALSVLTPFDFTIAGVGIGVSPVYQGEDLRDDEGNRIVLPPIPGIIVIPNNIGFLNRYFSTLLLVTKAAPKA